MDVCCAKANYYQHQQRQPAATVAFFPIGMPILKAISPAIRFTVELHPRPMLRRCSEYTDDTILGAITYYLVTAVDTTAIESLSSSEVSIQQPEDILKLLKCKYDTF